LLILYYQYDFIYADDPGELNILGRTVKVGKFICPRLGKTYYKSTVFQVYVEESIVQDRLSKLKQNPTKKDELNPNRESDWLLVMAKQNPFDTYDFSGQKCPIPNRFIAEGSAYSDEFHLKRWQSFVDGLVKGNKQAGTHPRYMRFRLAPTSGSANVFFTPLGKQAVFGVTKKLLQAVIDQSEASHGRWKLAALTYAEAEAQQLKIVGTNFLHLYHTWMKPDEYAALWVGWVNPLRLPLPFPKDNPATRKMFTKLAKGVNVGKLAVDEVSTPLTTSKMQTASRQRTTMGEDPGRVMGKSATEVF
jgi:hypothetical protein